MPTRISFQLARVFFWMPNGVECVTADMRNFVCTERRTFDAIGIDVGGPCFSYEAVLQPATIARVRGALSAHGRIAINISCDVPDDPVPGRIADRFKAEGLGCGPVTENAASTRVNVEFWRRPAGSARACRNCRRELVSGPPD